MAFLYSPHLPLLHFHLLHFFPLILLLQLIISLAAVLLLILHPLPLIPHCHQLIHLLEYYILLSRNFITAVETQGSLLSFCLYKVQTHVYELLVALRRPKPLVLFFVFFSSYIQAVTQLLHTLHKSSGFHWFCCNWMFWSCYSS